MYHQALNAFDPQPGFSTKQQESGTEFSPSNWRRTVVRVSGEEVVTPAAV